MFASDGVREEMLIKGEGIIYKSRNQWLYINRCFSYSTYTSVPFVHLALGVYDIPVILSLTVTWKLGCDSVITLPFPM